jgi:hypothetical protein
MQFIFASAFHELVGHSFTDEHNIVINGNEFEELYEQFMNQ